DAVGHEVPHRVSATYAIPAVRGRDRQGGNLESGDLRLREPVGAQYVTRPGYGDEMRKIPEFIMLPPTENPRNGVCAGDEEELSVRSLFVQIAQCVDRVGQPLAIDVDAAHGEPRVRCRRDDGHQIAVLAR